MRTRIISAALGGAIAAGCGGDSQVASAGKSASDSRAASETETPKTSHDHAMVGPHGGPLVEWGEEEYHPELVVDPAKRSATVYILDGSAGRSRAIRAKQATLTLKLKPPVAVVLAPDPQEGDAAAGGSSRFVGSHPALGETGEVGGSISAEIDGRPYSGDFKPTKLAARAAPSDELKKVAAESVGGTPFEQELYLKPGGLYTAEDIRANGSTVPSVKFKGKHWPHDDDLKKGDRVCPVTDNKADADCIWIVGGKKYQFCCVPCIDKFVKWAKTTPAKIRPPETYVKQ